MTNSEKPAQETLLKQSGLSSAGPDAAARAQISGQVLDYHRRLWRSQRRAAAAWIAHAILFSVSWGLNFGATFTLLFGSLEHVAGGVRPHTLDGFPGGNPVVNLFAGALTLLDGLVFTFAILATIVWLYRAWYANAHSDLLYRHGR